VPRGITGWAEIGGGGGGGSKYLVFLVGAARMADNLLL